MKDYCLQRSCGVCREVRVSVSHSSSVPTVGWGEPGYHPHSQHRGQLQGLRDYLTPFRALLLHFPLTVSKLKFRSVVTYGATQI